MQGCLKILDSLQLRHMQALVINWKNKSCEHLLYRALESTIFVGHIYTGQKYERIYVKGFTVVLISGSKNYR